MFDNLALLAAVIIIAWLGIFIYYMVTSQKQTKLQDEIKEVDQLLGGSPEPDHDETNGAPS